MAPEKKGRPNLDDYVTVAERSVKFFEKYPEGSLQGEWEIKTFPTILVDELDPETKEPTGVMVERNLTFVCYTAYAYRNPQDPRPGIGHVQELWPGRTPYTRGSEIMNAQTSAWGRAFAALGIETSKTIASREEIRNQEGEAERPAPVRTDPREEAAQDLYNRMVALRDSPDRKAGLMTLIAEAASAGLASYRKGGTTLRAVLDRELQEATATPMDRLRQQVGEAAEAASDKPGQNGPEVSENSEGGDYG